jgi:hypothetical protein
MTAFFHGSAMVTPHRSGSSWSVTISPLAGTGDALTLDGFVSRKAAIAAARKILEADLPSAGRSAKMDSESLPWEQFQRQGLPKPKSRHRD